MEPKHVLEYATPSARKPRSALDVAIVLVMAACALWIALMGVFVGVMLAQPPHETRPPSVEEYALVFVMMWTMLSSPALILLMAGWLLRRWRRKRIAQSDSSQHL